MFANKFEECITSSRQTLNEVVCPGRTRAKIDKGEKSGMDLHGMYSRDSQLPTPLSDLKLEFEGPRRTCRGDGSGQLA